MTGLARMARLAGQMMTNASIALHQTDLALASRVIAERDQMTAMHDDTEQRCIILLALQAPVAGDLRVVVAVLHAVGHVQRMSNLARHIALVARLKHPNPMVSGKVRPVLARMSLLASQLADDAARALEHRDPRRCVRCGFAASAEPAMSSARCLAEDGQLTWRISSCGPRHRTHAATTPEAAAWLHHIGTAAA